MSCSWILAPKVTCLLKRIRNFFYLLGFFSVLCISTTKITCRKGFGVRNRLVCLRISAWNSKHHNNLECKTAGWCTATKQVQISPSGKRTFFSSSAKHFPFYIFCYCEEIVPFDTPPSEIIPLDSSKVPDHTCLIEKYHFEFRFFIGHSTQSSQCDFSVKYSVYIS